MSRISSLFPRSRRLGGLASVLACAALLPGCTIESMTVQLGWGSSLSTCFDAGVTRMDYTLYDSAGVVRRGTNVSCGDLVFSSIAIDNYELDVTGYDITGSPVYAATCTGMFFDGNDITHRCTVPPSGDPLFVAVDWDLSQSPSFVPGTCSEAGVFDYDVLLRNAAGSVISSSVENRCLNGELVLDFGIQPPGTYSFEITGYADDGIAYWFGNCSVTPSAFGESVCNAFDD